MIFARLVPPPVFSTILQASPAENRREKRGRELFFDAEGGCEDFFAASFCPPEKFFDGRRNPLELRRRFPEACDSQAKGRPVRIAFPAISPAPPAFRDLAESQGDCEKSSQSPSRDRRIVSVIGRDRG